MDSFSSPSSSSSSPQMSTGDFMDQLKVQLAQAYAEEFLEGDRCGIYGSNCPEWIISMEACNSNGITYVPLYDTLGANAVEYIINHAEVSLAFVQENKLPAKMERSGCYKNVIEYASHFAEVIAKGVLWENEDLVPQLCELIRLGFLVEFDEEAVEFLMKTKNMQIFKEDQEFLSSTFSS